MDGICGVEDRMAPQIARVALAYLSRQGPVGSTMTVLSYMPGHNLRSQGIEPAFCLLSNDWSNHILKNPSTQLSRCQRK